MRLPEPGEVSQILFMHLEPNAVVGNALETFDEDSTASCGC